MTSATIHLVAPTRAERKLLGLAGHLTAFVEHRIEQRAEKRTLMLELLRQQQAGPQDPHAADHMLAQMGISRR
ncbi:hypothetical protein [Microbacterium sp. WCS2018Hpa-9]|uniref:hypothetical protein n=1 Tax=Microbacterium sp. WCS2018Hpa-9 TaxID=3073635 RepID=UPI00288A606C|nr:hypothetical protein [Microbacterium sp. WCS2018Hpa-9]